MKYFFFFLSFLILASCSTYNSVLKGDDYDAKFKLANDLYANEKFERTVTLYEQVYQRMPKTPNGETSFYRLGKACYEVQDWYLASYYLTAFQNKFPYSEKVEETTYLAALCAVQNSPEPSLDQNETELALNELQQFINRFPNSDYVDSCNTIMDKLRFKLQTKDAMNVRMYAQTENYRAAMVTAETFIKAYPISQYREEVYAILVRNSYLLTKNSVSAKIEERKLKTREYYLEFLGFFPNSTYLRELEKYYQGLDDLIPTENN